MSRAKKTSMDSRVSELALAPKLGRRLESLLDRDQVLSAVQALLAYQKKSQADKLDLGAEHVLVQIGLKKSLGTQSVKPQVITVPHALRDEPSVCLFVKDTDKPWIKALTVEGTQVGNKKQRVKLDGTRATKKRRLEEPLYDLSKSSAADEASSVSKVIALSKLRTSYARYQARRELRDAYEVFVADNRILPMLTKALGSSFFSRKKQPIAIDVTQPTALNKHIQAVARNPTLVLKTGSNCIALNVAHTDMPADHIVDNVCQAVSHVIADQVPKHWSSVLNVHLKLHDTVALPVYNASFTPDEISKPLTADHDALSENALPTKKKKRKVETAPTDDDAKTNTLTQPVQKLKKKKKLTSDADTSKKSATERAESSGVPVPLPEKKTKKTKKKKTVSSV